MKIKLIAASLAALGSMHASAVVLNPATDTAAATYYIAGASAQAQAFNAIAPTLFDVQADVVQITAANAGTCAGQDNADANKHVAYFGKRGGVNTLLVYRNKDGSGGGVQQLLANVTTAAAITSRGKVISLPGSNNGGTALTATSNNCVATLPVAALSDVKHTELSSSVLTVAGTAGYDALSSLLSTSTTGLQGFGIAVNPALYSALVTANNDAGIPLVNGQPSIRKADYASLVNIGGTIKSAADLLNNSDSTKLEVARRVDVSGTQAASNLYFLAAKTTGAKTPATALNFPLASINTNGIAFSENSSTGNVKTALAQTDRYVIGVISLENRPCTGVGAPDASCKGAETWKFVAIDGVSPNQAYDLAIPGVVADEYQRQAVSSGSYDFAYESYVLYKSAAVVTAGHIVKALIDDLGKVSKSNLVGFSYLDDTATGSWATWDSSAGYGTDGTNKLSRVSRGGNNLSPLGY
jgi:hypothetical protein